MKLSISLSKFYSSQFGKRGFFQRRNILTVFLSFCISSIFCIVAVHAFDSISSNIPTGNATAVGSNSSIISFSTGTASTGGQYYSQYINKDDDSTIIGNYFSGYYYDSRFGFFQFNWDTSNPSENNVHVVGVTDKCGNGIIGYKLGGYSRGVHAGYMNFAYNDSIFVYYCMSDKKLHGYSFNSNEGFQNFEGLAFDIQAITKNIPIEVVPVNDQNFVNNFSKITDPTAYMNSEMDRSTIFYIIK